MYRFVCQVYWAITIETELGQVTVPPLKPLTYDPDVAT